MLFRYLSLFWAKRIEICPMFLENKMIMYKVKVTDRRTKNILSILLQAIIYQMTDEKL